MDTTVVCVKWGNKYGPEYVSNLRAMVAKNLIGSYKFVCLTDDPTGLECDTMPLPGNLAGWWNKVYLFKPGLFNGKVLYLDLDVCITGSLAPLITSHGIIKDWHLPTYNSSVMVWNAGDHADIWEKFTPDIATRLHGDQDWITELGGWELIPTEWCVSYRSHARDNPPENAKVVCFHGEPKPHDYPSQWVGPIWHGKTLITGYQSRLNTTMETMISQAEQNMLIDLPLFVEIPEHEGVALIVGGAPSLQDELKNLRTHKIKGGVIFALNGTHDWLIERGIIPDFHVLLDARQENVQFVRKPHKDVTYLVAAQCHPDIFKALQGYNVTIWTACFETPEQEKEFCAKFNKPICMVGGGATVGLKTLNLAYLWGFRNIRLYGMDSSYQGAENHAYRQELNDKESRMDIHAAGRDFVCAPWMAKQATEFQRQYRQLIGLGCKVKVLGDGLIPWIYQQLSKGVA